MASYSAATNVNLTQAKIIDIKMSKFGGNDTISLMPQLMEISWYFSLFRPSMTAELVLNDTVSLVTNYPMIGEEVIEITYTPTENDVNDARGLEDFRDNLNNLDSEDVGAEVLPKLKFVVSAVKQMFPEDTTRSSLYSIQLRTPEYLENMKMGIMRAYKQGYHENIQQILKDYLKADPEKIKTKNFEPSRGVVTTVVPNYQPFQTIMWFMQRAVPENTKRYNYFFYEDLKGYHFVTLQKLIEDGKAKKKKKSFIYFSNASRDQALSEVEQNSIAQSTVSAINHAKRYSTEEKISAGFYENEYVEIDLLQRTKNSTMTKAKDKPEGTIANSQINTPSFMNTVRGNNPSTGDVTRVRYVIAHGGGDQPNQERLWKDKFGEAARSYSALSQIQIVIAVPGDTRVSPGDIINLEIPEFQGFNETKKDPYIAGDYIVTDMKHTISVGMKHVMVLNLARDSYEKDIELQHNYNLNVR